MSTSSVLLKTLHFWETLSCNDPPQTSNQTLELRTKEDVKILLNIVATPTDHKKTLIVVTLPVTLVEHMKALNAVAMLATPIDAKSKSNVVAAPKTLAYVKIAPKELVALLKTPMQAKVIVNVVALSDEVDNLDE